MSDDAPKYIYYPSKQKPRPFLNVFVNGFDGVETTSKAARDDVIRSALQKTVMQPPLEETV